MKTTRIEFESKESAVKYVESIGAKFKSFNRLIDCTDFVIDYESNRFVSVTKDFKQDINGKLIYNNDCVVNCYSVKFYSYNRN